MSSSGFNFNVKVKMNSTNKIIKDHGLDKDGRVARYLRDTADLGLQKDVYKAIVRVNGKTHEYEYNKKDADIDDDLLDGKDDFADDLGDEE